MWTHLEEFLADLAGFVNLENLPSGASRFATSFKYCHALHLARRNKVRAAISYWLASKTGEWFWYGAAPRAPLPGVADFGAITKLHEEMHVAEIGWPLFLRASGIHSTTIFYEDWIVDPVVRVLDIANRHLHLGIDPDASIQIPLPLRQSDSATDEIEQQWTARTGGCASCNW